MPLKTKLILLFTIGFLLYLPSFGNQFVWDDEQFIYNNHYVLTFDVPNIFSQNTIAGAGEISNYYRPLTTLSFAIDHAIWGLNPIGFHLTNTVLHAAAGCLLFGILRLLKLDPKHPTQWYLQPSFLISLLFIIHPIQTEAVVYANSRGDSLATFWLFSGLACFVYALTRGSLRWRWKKLDIALSTSQLLLLSVITYIAAVFSKEIAITGVGLYGLIWLQQYVATRKTQVFNVTSMFNHLVTYYDQTFAILTLVTSAAGYLWLRSTVLNFNNSFNFQGHEAAYASSLLTRLLTFSNIFWTYLKLLVIPYPLHMERNSEIITDAANPWTISLVLLLTALAVVAWYEWRRTKHIWIAFGSLWFVGMLVPVSGIVPINGLIYEHWLYVPMVGFWIVIVRACQLGWEGMNLYVASHQKQFLMRALPTVVYSYLLLLVILTLRQNYLWGTPIRFYEHTLRYADAARLHNNLAMAYADQGRHHDAIDRYHQALDRARYPQTYHNLGNAYQAVGDINQAIASYQTAIELSPDFQLPYIQLLNLHLENDQKEEALKIVTALLEEYPDTIQLQQLQQQLREELALE